HPLEYVWIDDTMSALRRDFLPSDAKREMDAAGFDACIAVQARQTLDETRWLLELADRHAFIAGVVGWADLPANDVREQLTGFAQNRKLVGIRHLVQSEPDERFLLRPAFCRGIAALPEFGLTYDLLVYPRHLRVAAEFVARFERQPFVLDHIGKPDIRGGEIERWARDIQALAAAPNVWCKLSGLVTEADWQRWTPAAIRPYLDVVFECFGAGRLMIGSDWPVCTVAGDYRRTMAVVIDYLADRPAAEREAVLGGTATKLWKLNGHGQA
ncbi:MAG TPA: amidohydrolase family protein, partial [Vicinamibacterales bacterium]|nr:amidohydrolase family protein [Vicinamibacterales bacterium]